MKVILTTNIKKLGKVGDQVIVKDGFARNFLFPNKMALRDTKNNLQYYEKIKEEIIIKENEKKEKALNLIENIKKIEIKFTKEADEKDQLYGSISKKEIRGLMKTFVLYSRLPRSYWKEIKIAEQDNAEGIKKYKELIHLYKNEYKDAALARD